MEGGVDLLFTGLFPISPGLFIYLFRYLGQFLERNLELNQLSLNLTDGELLIQEVNINVHVSPFSFPL